MRTIKVLVPMSGADDAFRQKGYTYSKNLIELHGKPLIQHVYENLSRIPNSEFIFVIRKDEDNKYHLRNVLKLLAPSCEIIVTDELTAGAACTALLAIEHINNEDPLVIANADQIVDIDLSDAIHSFEQHSLDAGTLVFDSVHPRWSYVRLDEHGYVIEAAEKRPISRYATAGVYYFRQGKAFVQAAMEMIKKDAHTNGVFYVCPTFNELILEQAKIGVYKISRDSYFSIATPEGVQVYEEHLKHSYSEKAGVK
jgi:dTDP-glucose pyrophosphorylase